MFVQKVIATVCFVVTSLFFNSIAQSYSDDSLVVAEILAANGLDSLTVEEVTVTTNGRIGTLHLSGYNVSVLPECLGGLSELTYLDIARNRITRLPESIGQLSKLEHISAYDNFIYELPPTFSQLTSLIDIYLIRNNLTSWPEVFHDMPGMVMIDVGGNHLTEIPDEIAAYPSLKKLYIQDNFLTVLPEALTTMELEVVHVAGNALCGVSETLTAWLDSYDYYKEESKWKTYQSCDHFFIDSLKVRAFLDTNAWNDIPVDAVIDVVNGQIVGIDLSTGRRSSLPEAAYNEEKPIAVPDRLEEMKYLRSLNLAGNRLDSIPACFERLCHLEVLDLSATNVSTLPDFMVAFKNLRTLNISENIIEALPPDLAQWADAYAPEWRTTQLVPTTVQNRKRQRERQVHCSIQQVGSQYVNVELDFNESSFAEVVIHSLNGKTVKNVARQHFSTGRHLLRVDGSSFARGVYAVKVKTAAAGAQNHRFIMY